MRGIVSTNRTEIGDAAVAFHVDGFYSPRPQGATMLIHDLDQLEALRGPQGTLFGRNANAGVINVVTRQAASSARQFGALDLTVGQLRPHARSRATQPAARQHVRAARRRRSSNSATATSHFLPGSTVRREHAALRRQRRARRSGCRASGSRTIRGRCSPRPSDSPIAARARFP